MSSRSSTLSLNQKLTLFIAFLALIVTMIAALVSGHDWFSPPSPTSTETSTSSQNLLPNTDTPDALSGIEPSCIWKWEFNTNGDHEGWQVNMQVNNLRVDGGALHGEFGQFDPSLLSPQQLNIDTSRYTVISIGYQISSDDTDGQLMWNPKNDKDFSGAMQILYGIVTDGKWHTLNIRLNDDAAWSLTPIINALRLDPVHNATSGTFAYDYIRICEQGGEG